MHMLLQHGHVKSQQCFPIARWAKRTVSMGKANAQKKPAGKVHAKKPVKKDKSELPTTTNEPFVLADFAAKMVATPKKFMAERGVSSQASAQSSAWGSAFDGLNTAAYLLQHMKVRNEQLYGAESAPAPVIFSLTNAAPARLFADAKHGHAKGGLCVKHGRRCCLPKPLPSAASPTPCSEQIGSRAMPLTPRECRGMQARQKRKGVKLNMFCMFGALLWRVDLAAGFLDKHLLREAKMNR